MSSSKPPEVTFELDDSEYSRLQKARIKLNLTHWTNIETIYELKEDSSVKEALDKMKIEDPVSYNEKYSEWLQRLPRSVGSL